MKNFYVIGAMISEMPISLDSERQNQPLFLAWADGMCGILPVFTNKRKAKRYAKPFGADVEIISMELVRRLERRINAEDRAE